MTPAGRVELRLLGRFAALRDGVEVPPAAFAGRKVRTLVKVLASRQGRFVSHDTLAEALWPGRPPADPVANLQVLVNRARRALRDPSLVITGQGGYTLAGPPQCSVDAERFLATVEVPSASLLSLRDALALWQGEPLPEEAYDDWAADYRSVLLRARQHALERVASLALDAGDVETAVEQASRAVEAEPLREAAVVLLMEALAASGDVAAALTAYTTIGGVSPTSWASTRRRRPRSCTSACSASPRRGRPRRGGDAGRASGTSRSSVARPSSSCSAWR